MRDDEEGERRERGIYKTMPVLGGMAWLYTHLTLSEDVTGTVPHYKQGGENTPTRPEIVPAS